MNMPMNQPYVSGLEASRILTKATRSWVWATMAEACNTARGKYVDAWHTCFDTLRGRTDGQMGETELASLWGAFMRHLTITGTARFLLGCEACGRGSEDEKLLLGSVAAHQRGAKKDACTILEKWFVGAALWKADALIEAIADQLSVQEYMLPTACDTTTENGHTYTPPTMGAGQKVLN